MSGVWEWMQRGDVVMVVVLASVLLNVLAAMVRSSRD